MFRPATSLYIRVEHAAAYVISHLTRSKRPASFDREAAGPKRAGTTPVARRCQPAKRDKAVQARREQTHERSSKIGRSLSPGADTSVIAAR